MSRYRDEDVDQLREAFHELYDRLWKEHDQAKEQRERHGREGDLGLESAKASDAASLRDLWWRFDMQYGGWRTTPRYNWSPDRKSE
jgi:hypothetical protein